MISASDANAHELLDQFLAENPPKQLTDALTKFLSSPLPTLHHPVSWMPPADEVAVRLDLVRQLQKNFIKSICGLEQDFMFTASQVAVLVLMPLRTLRALVADTGPDRNFSSRVFAAEGGLFFILLQGQHPDAATKKRKTPGQEPQPVEQPRDADLAIGQGYVRKNEHEKKMRLERDQNKCIFTNDTNPEVCHIVPFAFNSTTTNLRAYTTNFCCTMAALFIDQEDALAGNGLVASGLGCSDKSWNMLCIDASLHAAWSRPQWAIECIGIEPSDESRTSDNEIRRHAVVLVFHWMPPQRGDADPDKRVSLEPGTSDYRDMMDRMSVVVPESGERHRPGSVSPIPPITMRQYDLQPPFSGQEFRVVHDTREDAEKMQKMVNMQWCCVRLAAMSGATGPDDLDDDFSEIDYEREEYEIDVWRREISQSRDA